MNQDQFILLLKEKGITLTPKQVSQFELYFQLLIEWNEKMNLTAITEKGEVYLKHFYDSISAAFYVDFTKEISICDVGAGAGFPSIPIKICFPHLRISIVDSLQKRINFLNELAKQLDLSDVHFYHNRAETFGQNPAFREKYDLVTARAVARLSVLSELCLPLVKQNGLFVAMKGAAAKDELEQGQAAIKVLGGALIEEYSFQLPTEESERSLFIIEKKRKTPKEYPRKAGTPNKTPIV
ncbi:16S rRNA (guanine(527)-N(7))-methyltransferase RsmG [Bacillus sp. DJP31]|uniref:16S rRNA (guanine(527)-N(7))-methyltransferase RsmG n=1 Tax=Bacillus sp. DJP31 TaxID=3409789 RepID=UPI003BB755B5